MPEMDFDSLIPEEVLVKYQGKKLILREPSANAVALFQNAKMQGMKVVDGKVSGIMNVGEADLVLLSQCIYFADENGKLRLNPMGDPDPRYLVALATIKGWLYRFQKRLTDELYGMAPDLGGKEDKETLLKRLEDTEKALDELEKNGEAGSKEKNSPGDTGVSSVSLTS